MISAPIKQINHKFIDRAVDQWLEIHFGDRSFDGRVVIGQRKHGGGIYTLTARSLSELRQYVMLMHASNKIDYYITANTVSGTRRVMGGLFGLQNIVIDIDCHSEDYSVGEISARVQALLWRLERDLWGGEGLPRPNSIVRTGRGVQLWWALKPCHASCRPYYDQIKTGLMDHIDDMLDEYSELAGLRVDRTASGNPVGYFRLPCTYNTAAKRYGTLQVLHSDRYDTHDLAGYIYPLERPAKPTGGATADSEPVPMQAGDLIVLHNAHSTGSRRVMQLVKLRNLRNNEAGEETRNNLCFAVYNSLRMSYDHDEAMDRLRAYNSGFKQPMTERELQHTICSAKRRGGYRYTNAKLIELLKITEAEQNAIGLHPFSGQYRPWAHAKPNATRDAVRQARREGRNARIIELYQAGISQAETARKLGLSRNTVASVIRDWTALEAEKAAREELLKNGSIYDCLIGAAEVAVSVEDGQSPAPVSGAGGGVFVLPKSRPPGGG